MSSWALVGDVWFLEPQQRLEGESAIEFAGRVQRLIAERAKLEIVPWDGYLKYYNLEKKVLRLLHAWCTLRHSPHMILVRVQPVVILLILLARGATAYHYAATHTLF